MGGLFIKAAGSVGVKIAAKEVLTFSTKTAAKEGLERLGLSEAQKAAARSAIGRATTRETIELIQQSNGNLLVHLIREGRDGFQVVQTVVRPDATKVVTQYGISESGRIHIHPKFP